MSKQCDKGTSCGNTCIENQDDCRKKISLKSKPLLKKIGEIRRVASGGRNNTYDTIIEQATTLFNSEEASAAFKDAARNYQDRDNVKLLGDIRHQLEVGGQSYDKILDNARAASGLDNRGWNKIYNSAKNQINGIMAKKLLESKGNCDD